MLPYYAVATARHPVCSGTACRSPPGCWPGTWPRSPWPCSRSAPPGAPVGFSATGIPCPTWPGATGKWPCSCRRLRGWQADAELAHLDYRVWGAHPTVWLERIVYAHPHGILTNCLYPVRAGRAVHRFSAVAARALRGVSLLRISDRTGLPGVVRGLCAGARARSALFLAQPANHRSAWLVGHACATINPRPAGIQGLGLLSQRPHRTHHPGVVGQPHDLQPAILDLFRLYLVHHFCYSLSSIPLHHRPAGRGSRGRSSGADRTAVIPNSWEKGPHSWET